MTQRFDILQANPNDVAVSRLTSVTSSFRSSGPYEFDFQLAGKPGSGVYVAQKKSRKAKRSVDEEQKEPAEEALIIKELDLEKPDLKAQFYRHVLRYY